MVKELHRKAMQTLSQQYAEGGLALQDYRAQRARLLNAVTGEVTRKVAYTHVAQPGFTRISAVIVAGVFVLLLTAFVLLWR